jgi:hypothetical protein
VYVFKCVIIHSSFIILHILPHLFVISNFVDCTLLITTFIGIVCLCMHVSAGFPPDLSVFHQLFYFIFPCIPLHRLTNLSSNSLI